MVIFTDHERNIERVYVFLVDLLHNIYYYHEHWNVFPKTIHTEYALKNTAKDLLLLSKCSYMISYFEMLIYMKKIVL